MVKRKTSDPPDISNNRRPIRRFWNEFTATETKNWWTPPLTLEKQNVEFNSWFTVKRQAGLTSTLSLTQSFPPINNEEVRIRSRKIRLYPSTKQKETLTKWMDTARWTYNKTIEGIQWISKMKKSLETEPLWNEFKEFVHQIREEKEKEKDTISINLEILRYYCVYKKNCFLVKQDPELVWIYDTPSAVRDAAMLEALLNYTTNISNFKTGLIKKFNLKFKSKKHLPQETISIYKKFWNEEGYWFPSFWGKDPIKSAEKIPTVWETESKVIRTREGLYYLVMMNKVIGTQSGNEVGGNEGDNNNGIRGDNQTSPLKAISFDPGVRTFLTGYDPAGVVYHWGEQDMNSIYRLSRCIDRLKSQQSKPSYTNRIGVVRKINHKRRTNMKRAEWRLRQRIKNRIDDFHHKCSKWICQNYNIVLLPTFDSKNMVKRGRRRLANKSVRQLVNWSHGKFRKRLQDKMKDYSHRLLIDLTEEYTSKTCGNCGQIHIKLGSSKVFTCPYCQTTMDRDVNGARNIWLKWLTEKSAHLRPTQGLRLDSLV